MYKCNKQVIAQTGLIGTLDNAWGSVSVPNGKNLYSFIYNEDFYKSYNFFDDEKIDYKCKLIMTDPDYTFTLFDNIDIFYRNCFRLLRDDGFLALIIDVRSRDANVNKVGCIHIPHLIATLCGKPVDDPDINFEGELINAWHKNGFDLIEIGHIIDGNDHKYIFLFGKKNAKILRGIKLLWDNELAIGMAQDPEGEREPFQDNLLAGFINALTDKNDWVCDPFCGTNSVGKYCLANGRNYIGFEIDHKQYLKISGEQNE